MDNLNEYIKIKMDVRKGDHLPFTGWNSQVCRNKLAVIMGEVGFKYGAEIGVLKGAYSQILCESIPHLHLLCIDPWTPYKEMKLSQDRQDRNLIRAQERLQKYNVSFICKTSMEAVKEIADQTLDFVYIDAMHDFDNCMLDIIHWTPKVRMGGIVAGHDYVEHPEMEVINAVRTYTYAHNIYEWYITQDGDTNLPSWFWVRE